MAESLKPWFSNPGIWGVGERTLNQQLQGLAPLFEGRVGGKTVLDLGCAEGCLSHMLRKAGAELCHGVDIRDDFIRYAVRGAGGGYRTSRDPLRRKNEVQGFCFEEQDINTWRPLMKYDVVLALGVLHELSEPAKVCAEFAAYAKELMVIRFPGGKEENIIDKRSGNVVQPIGQVMLDAGFKPGYREVATKGELTVIYERVA